jgi:hypothetical protein
MWAHAVANPAAFLAGFALREGGRPLRPAPPGRQLDEELVVTAPSPA